jgi:hypothetical protein
MLCGFLSLVSVFHSLCHFYGMKSEVAKVYANETFKTAKSSWKSHVTRFRSYLDSNRTLNR